MPSSRALDDPLTDAPAHGRGFPVDEHDRRLLENVHPSGWRNPDPASRYHLVVLGAGTAGLVSAAIGAGLGARVALVERHLMGGDCLNVGCVPSKAVLRAARAWSAARGARDQFGGPEASGAGDFAAAMERMRRLRARISAHDSAARFRDLGVDVFLGEARFAAPDRVEVGGAALRFRRAILATGARAAAPPIPGLAEAGFLTNETVFSLTALPERLVVLGGGPVGCELAQAFARFGSRVTLVEMADRILPRDDGDAARVVRDALERDGVEVLAGARVTRVEARGEERIVHVRAGGKERRIAADQLLVAAGRAPNVDGLGLDAAGIRHDRSGVTVDDRLRTSNRSVYAVGDVNGLSPFTHSADAQARLAVQNALFFGRGRVSKLVIPQVTYTSPELAQVGITADEAEQAGDGVDTLTVPMAEVDRARLDGAEEGFLRIHLRPGSDQILGATLVGEHAGEIISHVATAMTSGIGIGGLGQTIFPYPTRAEVLRKAADAWRRRKLTPRAQKAFALFFRVFR